MIEIKRMIMANPLLETGHFDDLMECPPTKDWDLIAFLEEDVVRYEIEGASELLRYVVFEGEDGKLYRAYAVVQFEEVEPDQLAIWQGESDGLE